MISAIIPILANVYDYGSRRVRKTTPSEMYAFLYDGWNPVRETVTPSTGSGAVTTNSHYWGIDISGTMQGAGGVGGLLASRINGALYFPLYDVNGNITGYISESGAVVARREYDAFGNTAAKSGPMADTFNFWFSTKYLDVETGLYYYGYRFYSSETGRWTNKDPYWGLSGRDFIDNAIGAKSPIEGHDYRFLENRPVDLVEYLGLMGIFPEDPLPEKQHEYATVVIKVKKCQIVAVYGHNWRNIRHPRSGTGLETIRVIKESDKQDPPCAYAAVLGCFASYVPNDIPLPGYTPLAKDQELNYGRGPGTEMVEPDDILESQKILKAAKDAANSLFASPCCCKQVNFTAKTYGRSLDERIFGSIPNELADQTFKPEAKQ